MQYLIQLCLQVTALTMTLVLDGSHQPLISEDTLDEAIASLRLNKTADSWGLTSEAIKSLSPENRLALQSIFEARAKDTNISSWSNQDESWWNIVVVLLAKSQELLVSLISDPSICWMCSINCT